jgi:protocadherin Fat 4
LSSEHAVTVFVLDQNDSPSSPRSVHVTVHSLNGQSPLGKVADVRPNDPDTSGDYTCKILQGLGGSAGALSIPAACDLHAGKITPGSCSRP